MAIVEVKCPYSFKDCIINSDIPYLIQTNSELTLSTNPDYYYQVQGQLLCSNRELCYFCV